MAAASSVLLVGGLPDLGDLFENLDCRVELASSLDDALRRVKSAAPDLVLSDYPSLEPIRDVSPDVRVIVMAGEAPKTKILAALDEEAYAYFAPPFDLAAIGETIREALESPDRSDAIQVISREPSFITLRLRCQLATADRLVRFVLQMKSDLQSEERSHVAMAFREMLINAIEHGGKLDPNAWVRVSRIRTARTIVYVIQDPGPGFSRKDLKHAAVSNPDDSPAEHMKVRAELGLRAGGFGMMMAQQMVDEILYNEQGNEVLLIKHLD